MANNTDANKIRTLIGISTVRHRQELERDFQVQSQALYETIRQRLDQNEAVLSGIEALFRTFPNLQFDGVRGYARAMLSRYPHIYTVGLQPRIELKDVPAFEAEASRTIRAGYRIKFEMFFFAILRCVVLYYLRVLISCRVCHESHQDRRYHHHWYQRKGLLCTRMPKESACMLSTLFM